MKPIFLAPKPNFPDHNSSNINETHLEINSKKPKFEIYKMETDANLSEHNTTNVDDQIFWNMINETNASLDIYLARNGSLLEVTSSYDGKRYVSDKPQTQTQNNFITPKDPVIKNYSKRIKPESGFQNLTEIEHTSSNPRTSVWMITTKAPGNKNSLDNKITTKNQKNLITTKASSSEKTSEKRKQVSDFATKSSNGIFTTKPSDSEHKKISTAPISDKNPKNMITTKPPVTKNISKKPKLEQTSKPDPNTGTFSSHTGSGSFNNYQQQTHWITTKAPVKSENSKERKSEHEWQTTASKGNHLQTSRPPLLKSINSERHEISTESYIAKENLGNYENVSAEFNTSDDSPEKNFINFLYENYTSPEPSLKLKDITNEPIQTNTELTQQNTHMPPMDATSSNEKHPKRSPLLMITEASILTEKNGENNLQMKIGAGTTLPETSK
ncbi:hypothetical protein HELRODRAFT_180759 [Helobdella robusta]|uniref:Uncharacterized protein n=1 Tax=Helobdella robusta TaxID=6412 RepID=T1FG88_HELRO|nr:hypothetical protein HELRODRAFT_180759 [Helobdella robusta]ESN93665.1 hypothetical protein HELRODRAFT_180759 [Helobdella robusta]